VTVSTIRIDDMHCASCVAKVQRALGGVAGIESTHINPVRRMVLVEHSQDTDPIALLQRIEDAGFHPSLSGAATASSAQRDMLKRLGIAGLAMMQVMMFAFALYAGAFTGMDEAYRRLIELASLMFCLPVVAYSARPFFRNAFAAWRTGLNMDVPVALAIGAAFTVSLANTLRGQGEVYYDSVVMFTFLLLGARYIDDRLKARFDAGNATLAALPEFAMVDNDGTVRPVPIRDIEVGSLVWVDQGNRIPLDGTVTRGDALVDESALTGESVAVRRRPGESVFAGTINSGAGFELRTTAVAEATRIAAIAELANRAQADKPTMARLADRIARYFVPGVLLLAATAFIGWQLVDPSRAFVAALTVLVVSCPCALSLATPATITAAMTRLRNSGIVLTRGDVLEQAARLDTALVDKTGTLTVHQPTIQGIVRLREDSRSDATLLQLAATLERHANHPLAMAFRRAAGDLAERAAAAECPFAVSDVALSAGAGIAGRVDGRSVRLGSAEFCGIADHAHAGVYMSIDEVPVARFEVSDPLRADAAEAVAGLKREGITVTMVSGDAAARCLPLAAQLGIDYVARQAPETKLQITRERQCQGHRVLVLGDGVNDIPALAAADVSATVVESSDLVKSKADVLLLSRRLGALVELVRVSRRAGRVMRQNLTWALAYNMTAIPIAALGFLPPWAAAIGMAGSSILVMSNAARLLAAPSPGGSPRPVAATLQPAAG
jgi:P-type Cu2+ transporter